MPKSPDWPIYKIGHRDSIFALGVASINYTELESVIEFLFATVFEIGIDAARMILARIGNEASLALMEQQLEHAEWAPMVKDKFSHFVKAANICGTNRHELLHSELVWDLETPILFKTTKRGRIHSAAPTLDELRGVADDIHALSAYGRSLGNAINNRYASHPPILGEPFPRPDKPVLPKRLEFAPGPRTIPS
jgi:hypothetical protein